MKQSTNDDLVQEFIELEKIPKTPSPVTNIGAIVIENISPQVDNGLHPVKCVVGDHVLVSADIYKDGHDVLRANVIYKKSSSEVWAEAPMRFVENDQWQASLKPDTNTQYFYSIEAWVDPLTSWLKDMEKRCTTGESLESDLAEGLILLNKLTAKVSGVDAALFRYYLKHLERSEGDSEKILQIIRNQDLINIILKYPLKENLARYERHLELTVDRRVAEYGSWYELFPRSQGKKKNVSGNFEQCIKRLPEIKKMGFNVLYLPPHSSDWLYQKKGAE